MDSLEAIANDLERMAETLDHVEDNEHWADTPADIADIYRTYAERIRKTAATLTACVTYTGGEK